MPATLDGMLPPKGCSAAPAADPSSAATPASHPVIARLRSLEPPTRLAGVDLARGLAVLGMFAAHLVVTTELAWSDPTTWTGMVDGRSSVLFATLAGLSLGLAAGPASGTDTAVSLRRRRLLVRAALIWGLGVLITLTWVPVNVILSAYGALFVLGAVMLALRPRTLFLIAGVLAVTMPFIIGAVNYLWNGSGPEEPDRISILLGWHFPFPLWAAFLALGLGAGKMLAENTRHAWGFLLAGTGLTVIGYGTVGPAGNRAAESLDERGDEGNTDLGLWLTSNLTDAPHSSGVGEAVGSGGFAVAVVAGCVLLCATPVRHVFWPVRVIGSMPLTAYTAHLLIWAVWMFTEDRTVTGTEAMNGFRALEPFWPMTLGVAAGCILWLVVVGKGPLEQLMTRISTTVVPAGAPHESRGR